MHQDTPLKFGTILFTILFFSVVSFFIVDMVIPSVFAESSILQDAIQNGLGGLGETIDDSISNSDLDDATKEKLYSVSRAGIDSADLFTQSWFSAHEFVVNGLLAGSPIPLPISIITMVSVGISTFLLWLVGREIFKKAKWVILIVVGVVLVFLAIGASPTF